VNKANNLSCQAHAKHLHQNETLNKKVRLAENTEKFWLFTLLAIHSQTIQSLLTVDEMGTLPPEGFRGATALHRTSHYG